MHVVAIRASHLVAAVFLYERMLALVAFPDESGGHCFLDHMPLRQLSVFIGFFAAERNMCLFVAQPAAGLAAFRVLAAKFFVHFYG